MTQVKIGGICFKIVKQVIFYTLKTNTYTLNTLHDIRMS